MSTPTFGARPNPLDSTASQAIGAMRASLDPRSYPRPAPPKLSEEERAEAQKAQSTCRLCAGIHPMPNSPACPRLATFKLNGDLEVVEGSFFQGTKWAKGRVIFLEDAHEEPEDGDGEG